MTDIQEKKPKCIGFIEVHLKGEIYVRRYAVANVEQVVKLINEMFGNEISIEIIECKEIYHDKK